ncbi:MAG TPA: heparin lyase I family protein [Solirubrobacterales bacterium]|nr:heparin lyase I family protein [Solirubrobacterales bacterium]
MPVSAPPPAPQPETAVAPPTRVAAGLGGGPRGPIGAGAGGSPSPVGAIQVREGDEYALSFPLWLDGTEYEAPGVESLITRFIGDTGEPPSFGLQLWDDGDGGRGLWSSGDAMGGERFLAPVAEGEWHEVAVFFRASSEGAGFYLLFLDGQPIDARAGVSLIGPGSSSAQIEVGLFRNGELVSGSPGVLLGAGVLSDTLEPILP